MREVVARRSWPAGARGDRRTFAEIEGWLLTCLASGKGEGASRRGAPGGGEVAAMASGQEGGEEQHSRPPPSSASHAMCSPHGSRCCALCTRFRLGAPAFVQVQADGGGFGFGRLWRGRCLSQDLLFAVVIANRTCHKNREEAIFTERLSIPTRAHNLGGGPFESTCPQFSEYASPRLCYKYFLELNLKH